MKEILLTSIVAATLIFSGCGSSSSSGNGGDNKGSQVNGVGDNNGSQNNGGGDNNGSQNNSGGDNNGSQGSGDENGTQSGNSVTINGYEWRILDNNETTGKLTWSDADQKCQQLNMELPSFEQFDSNASALLTNTTFINDINLSRSGGNRGIYLWTNTNGQVIYLNDNNRSDNSPDNITDNSEEHYFTCIKPAK